MCYFLYPWLLFLETVRSLLVPKTCHLACLVPPFWHPGGPWDDPGALGSTRKETLGSRLGFSPRCARVPSTQQRLCLVVLFEFVLLLGACLSVRRRAAPHGRSGGRGGASHRLRGRAVGAAGSASSCHGAPLAPH